MRARPVRETHLALLLVLALAFAGSCARSVPTAPGAASQPSSVKTPGRHFGERAALRDFGSQVVVTLAPGANPAELATEYGATLLEWDARERVAAFLPPQDGSATSLLASMTGDPQINTVETNERVQLAEARQKSFAFDDGLNTLSQTTAQPALEALHVAQALGVSVGNGVRVAILDTGIDPDHPLIRNRIAASWDFIEGHAGATDVPDVIDSNGDGVLDEAWGHGTHLAGIVALTAPGASLLVGRVLDSDGQGDVLTVAAGIRWAVENHAQVINLSLGTFSTSSAIANALEEAQAQGIVIVASAGNWGAEQPQEFPARSEDVTTAVAACDAWGVPAPWTSFGNFVGITAPGVSIRSAFPGGTYRLWSGTSMSAPFVSATAALLIADHPDWTPAQVKGRIYDTAGPLYGVGALQQGKLGHGMLDVGAALAPDGDADSPPAEDFLPHH